MNIIRAFKKSIGEYESIQKSSHWKKYDRRRHLYTLANLENFRNNQLSEGLDDTFPVQTQQDIYDQLIAEVGERYVRENLTDKNIGNGQHCFVKEGLVIDGGQNYIIRWLYDLEKFAFIEGKGSLVCEIGGGYGAMAQKIRTRFGCKILLIDLPEANILSSHYLSKHFPEAKFLLVDEIEGRVITKEHIQQYDFVIVPPWYTLADDVLVDMFINTRSMMEMNIGVIKRYFDFIQRHTKVDGFFFNLNRYQQRSVGYPIQCAKYPYDEKGDVALSKPAWRQDDHHLLVTRRTSQNGTITEEMRRIAQVGTQFIPRPTVVQRARDVVNRFRHQYL